MLRMKSQMYVMNHADTRLNGCTVQAPQIGIFRLFRHHHMTARTPTRRGTFRHTELPLLRPFRPRDLWIDLPAADLQK